MVEANAESSGPDLTQGIALADLPDGGKLVGHCGNEQVLLVRRGAAVFAIRATCTHYGGPLVGGLVVEDTIRCPWHHACFDLRTGEASRAPAFSPLACWSVEQREGRIFVGEKLKRTASMPRSEYPAGTIPNQIVIIGGGAAGFAAAEALRRQQYRGSIIMLSSDEAPPVDRPNLSKDYLAGKAPEDWIPLRDKSFYTKNDIDLRLNTTVVDIDAGSGEVVSATGRRIPYDKLLLATGAEPVRTIPGADQPHVHTLRSFADCKAIIERAATARRAIVLGASFIGLEVAAALRSRGIEVHVVAPDKRPLERILGPEIGDFIRALHEKNGVVFHLGNTASSIDGMGVKLSGGDVLTADFIVAGIGVRPRMELAETAGLSIDRGVIVNAFLETSAPGIFAAGDIARWPDPHSGENIRVEHWVVAERQGRTAALNMLGLREKFVAVPYFWSQHYDVSINYVGHASSWDDISVEGDVAARDCLLRFKRAGRTLAVASIFRDIESLSAEAEMERRIANLKELSGTAVPRSGRSEKA